LIDPHLLTQFAADMSQSFLAIEAKGFKATIAEHLEDLCVFLTFFFEGEFTLLVIVLVLSTTPVLSSLYNIKSVYATTSTFASLPESFETRLAQRGADEMNTTNLSLILRHFESLVGL